MKTTLFERQNVGTIGEHNDDDNGHGMAVMMIITNVRKKVASNSVYHDSSGYVVRFPAYKVIMMISII